MSWIAESPSALRAVAHTALGICHWSPSEGAESLPATAAELVNTGPDGGASCSRWLL